MKIGKDKNSIISSYLRKLAYSKLWDESKEGIKEESWNDIGQIWDKVTSRTRLRIDSLKI